MDDILIHGRTPEEHSRCLFQVLQRLDSKKVMLNKEKCFININRIRFLGHIIDSDGIKVDPERITALENLPPPKNVSDVRSLLGMLNQLNKFIPNLAEKSEPIRILLKKEAAFVWSPAQVPALAEVFKEIRKEISLTRYDINAPSVVMADASAYGLGGVLFQESNGRIAPVTFASRSLSETERRYTQIEKEGLALAWEKFSVFLLGMKFEIQTDHKSLVPLLSTRDLSAVPPRIQRFKMRLMKFNFTITHVPGKAANVVSRAPLLQTNESINTQSSKLFAAGFYLLFTE